MKTTTILDAYMQAKARELGINFVRRGRQAVTFRAALLSRIEAGDRAREALRNIQYLYGQIDDVAECYHEAYQIARKALEP